MQLLLNQGVERQTAHAGFSASVVSLGVADKNRSSFSKDPDPDLLSQFDLSYDDSGDDSCCSLLEGRVFRKPTTLSKPTTPKKRVLLSLRQRKVPRLQEGMSS